MIEAFNYYEQTLEEMASIAIDIAIHQKDWKDVSLISLNSMFLGNFDDHNSISKRRNWAVIKAKTIEDPLIKENTLYEIDNSIRKVNIANERK